MLNGEIEDSGNNNDKTTDGYYFSIGVHRNTTMRNVACFSYSIKEHYDIFYDMVLMQPRIGESLIFMTRNHTILKKC